jgi:hypothetical protein
MRRIALTTVAVLASSLANAAQPAKCPAGRLLPEFDAAFHECGRGFENGSCKRFVAIFRELLPKYDCRRSFDTDPVPAAWIANSAALEDYVKLLSELRTADARELFGSKAFREILDGALAEDYGEKSRAVEKSLASKPPRAT